MSITSKSGIYSITNKINGKIYYGSAIDIKRRWSEHKRELRKNIHCNQHLQRDYNKCGKDSFEFKVELEVYPEYLIFIEQAYLDDNPDGYNMCRIARSVLGRVCSEETKRKISKSNTGRKLSEEHKQKLSIAKLGKKMKEEVRLKMVGRKIPPEVVAKVAAANRGSKRSEETRKKMSAWQIGRKMPREGVLKSVLNKKLNKLKKLQNLK